MESEILAAVVRANAVLAVAVIAIIALREPIRSYFGARVTYALWALAPIAALASLLPARRIVEVAPAVNNADAVAATFNDAVDTALVRQPLPPLPTIEHATSSASDLFTPTVLVGLWAAGVVASICLLAWRQHRFVARIGRLERAELDGAPVLRARSSLAGPALIGVMRPRIVLPANFEAHFSADERALILAHEQTHLKHGDAPVNGVIALAASLCWFNPLAHVAAALAKRDQELACDADVIARHPASKRAYAEALLKSQTFGAPVPLGCAWPAQGPHPLRERIVLLGAARPGWAQRALGGVAVVLLSASAAAIAWATQPPVYAAAPMAPVETDNDGFVEPLAQLSAASINGATQTFNANAVELTSIAAMLQVVPEDRGDIAVSISGGGARLPAPRLGVVNGRLVIDGGLGERGNDCERRFTGTASAFVAGVGQVSAADLPRIVLRTPRQLNLRIRGVTPTHIGASAGGVVTMEGCGDARIEASSGALQVGLYGYGNVDVAPVHGDLIAELYGIGDMRLAGADANANLVLQGEGDMQAGPVSGALSARLQGEGDMIIGAIGRGAQLNLQGAGAIRTGAITGALDVDISGSGPIRVDALNGPLLTINVPGASQIAVARGAVDDMNVTVSGEADIRFGGHARTVRARFDSGGDGEVSVARADHVETERSEHSTGEVITGR